MAGKLPIKTGHLFLGLAVVMAIVSAVLLKNVALSGKPSHKAAEASQPVVQMANVAVALNPLPPGTVIGPDDITLAKWPKDYLPQGSIFNDANGLLGRVVVSELLPGEPIYKEKLARDGARGGLQVVIPPGMRAVTIKVNEVKSVAGFVRPGVHVDILGTFKRIDANDNEFQVTKTILQNVLVLASAQRMVDEDEVNVETPNGLTNEPNLEPDIISPEEVNKKDKKKDEKALKAAKKEREKQQKELEARQEKKEKWAKKINSVTVALWPDDAEKLALGEEIGELRLVLRPEDDTKSDTALKGVTDAELLNLGAKGATKAVSATTNGGVEFIKGTEKSVVAF
jgi:Flp pilus assembly protein CpaB